MTDIDILAEKKVRIERQKERSADKVKDKLIEDIKKKMTTIMIGALSQVEEHFDFLWTNEDGSEVTENQQYVADLYQELRSKILDLGNNQIRNMKTEMDKHNVEKKRYYINMTVRKEG